MLTNLLVLTIACIALPQPAHAYIDPCAGGYLVQALFGFILAAGATVRSYFSFKKKTANAQTESRSTSKTL